MCALVWDGAAVVFVRLGSPLPGQDAAAVPSPSPTAVPSADLSDGLARLIAEVEAELGGSLASLGRPEKQRAVRLLEERGAFEMRRSAETVAEALGRHPLHRLQLPQPGTRAAGRALAATRPSTNC